MDFNQKQKFPKRMLILANSRKLSRCHSMWEWDTLGPTSPTKYKPPLHLIPFKISPATKFGKRNVNIKQRPLLIVSLPSIFSTLFSSLTSLTSWPSNQVSLILINTETHSAIQTHTTASPSQQAKAEPQNHIQGGPL